MVFELVSHGCLRPGTRFYQYPEGGHPENRQGGQHSPGHINLRSRYHEPMYDHFRHVHDRYKRGEDATLPTCEPGELHVGIIGAGMAGLLSAHILKKAGIKVTIFEVNDRVGGRINTHYFHSDKTQKWQYGEFGAMRLPYQDAQHNPIKEHELVFKVIEYLNKVNKHSGHEDRHIELIKFIFSNPNGHTFYNNTTVDNQIMTNEYAEKHPEALGFPVRTLPNGSHQTIQQIWSNALTPFINLLHDNFNNGLKKLALFDSLSVRDYLIQEMGIEETYVSSIETYSSATGLFRLAFSEAVIDGFTFDSSHWRTVEGGMQRFPNAFLPLVGENIKYKNSVQELKRLPDNKVGITYTKVPDNQHQFPPLTPQNSITETFDHVIVTCPLGVVRRWDLPDFSFGKRTAIRCLNYDNSAKIFLQFRTRFWEDPAKTQNPIVGGTSSTDLPIRTIVYPSYGINSGEPGVLLVSYTWANDAARFGANSDEDVAELALRDLVKIHGKVARDEYLGRNGVHYWSTDPIAGGGAFALFEPGQFTSWIKDIKRPEFNIHFAGEHTDVHHGWIVGALNSAVYATHNVMEREGHKRLFHKVAEPFINQYSLPLPTDPIA